MAREAELADGTVLEFPDGTPDEVMQRAVRGYLAKSKSPEETEAELQRLIPGVSIDPTQGMSGLDKFRAGAGKAFADTGRGLAQLVGQGPSREEVDATRALEAPLMDTGAGIAGNIIGQIGLAASPIGAGARVASYAGRAAPFVNAAIQGAALGGAQNVGTGESRAANAGIGAGFGAVGQGVATATRGLASGAVSRLDDAGKALAAKAESAGIRLGAGQLTQNPLYRTIVSQMERLPLSGGAARGEANQQAFNRGVAQEIGADADKITTSVFSQAKRKISDSFEQLANQNSLRPSVELTGELARISDEATRLGGSDTARMVNGWVKELLQKSGDDGLIPGKAYQSFDSRIGQVIKSGGEPSHYLGMLRDAVRGAMDNSIAPADRAAWQTARRQWAALKTIEPLVAKSTTGDISPAALMGRVTADKSGKARMAVGGSGNLGDLARVGQRFLKEPPNSGTPDRAIVNAAAAGGGAGLLAYLSPTVAATTGATLLGNRTLLGALNSRAITQGNNKALLGLARASKVAPRLLPVAAMSGPAAAFDIGTVYGLDPNDPRYRGN